MANGSSKWDEAIREAQQQQQSDPEGFVAMVTAELIPHAVPVKGIGIVAYDPNDPAHAGATPRKAAKIICQTRRDTFARTMFLTSEEFRMFHSSVQALGLTMDDIEAGVLARIVNRPIVRANGQPATFMGRDGSEKVKTAWVLAELIEPDDDADDADFLSTPNTPQPYYPPPQNANEQAAKKILELAYARLPSDVTDTPQKLVAAIGSKRRNESIREVGDERLLELAALVIASLRGPDELPF